VDRTVSHVPLRHAILFVFRAVRAVRVLPVTRFVNRPLDRVMVDPTDRFVDRFADRVPLLAAVLFVHRPTDGVRYFPHHGLIDGAVTGPDAVFPHGLVADAVADLGHPALFDARGPDGVTAGATVSGLHRSPERRKGDQQEQRAEDLAHHQR